jgi:hypothetical protein
MDGRKTIAENVVHPEHGDLVVGDLIRDTETGQYYLLEYRPEVDNYKKHSVPHAWARALDTTPTLLDEKREISGRDVILQAREAARGDS